jgi:hypothetical protein
MSIPDLFINFACALNKVQKIEINYTPLDSKKQYFFLLEQKFNPESRSWDDVDSNAD